MRNQKNMDQLLQRIPKKWAIALVAIAIVYAVSQPLLNSRFGWSLPGLNDLQTGQVASEGSSGARIPVDAPERGVEAEQVANSSTHSEVDGNLGGSLTETNPEFEDYLLAISPKGLSNQSELYDYLRPLGRGKYQSPRGLIYTRSSEDQHRILHIARHLEDQPSRAGKHGVFNGDIASVLRLIDDTYSKAAKKEAGTSQRNEGDRIVMESEFSKPIGYVGGRVGGRMGNPDAKRVRIVIANKNVVTAFPF